MGKKPLSSVRWHTENRGSSNAGRSTVTPRGGDQLQLGRDSPRPEAARVPPWR